MPQRKAQELEMKPVVYLLAAICAVLTVFGSCLVIPVCIVLFRYIEAVFAPDELATATAATASPSVELSDVPTPVVEKPRKKSRAARRRKPSKQLLAKVEVLKA